MRGLEFSNQHSLIATLLESQHVKGNAKTKYTVIRVNSTCRIK